MAPQRKKRWFGHGLPYLKLDDLSGTLISIEGTDGVGRSVQIQLLRQWLEVQGYGVVETGWTRSELMSETIGAAKSGNMLNLLTFSLLYATDFADRLEKIVIPALRSGFVVLADRYMYTAFARSVVRGAEPEWIRNVFGFAIVPDLTIYLKTDVEALVPRVFNAQQNIDFWEAGMDMHLGTDLYESFRRYQAKLIRQYNSMAKEFDFFKVNAKRSVPEIQDRIQRRIRVLLEEGVDTSPVDRPAAAAPLIFDPTGQAT